MTVDAFLIKTQFEVIMLLEPERVVLNLMYHLAVMAIPAAVGRKIGGGIV